MKYPPEVKTDMEKLEFVTRAEELMRLEHNAMGNRFLSGEITSLEWNTYKANYSN